ncbi:MAG: AMP-binding protein [Gammaproteobacteria bacterium]|nr:AMP-binding protein [Gammaproteobacteria bacterium]
MRRYALKELVLGNILEEKASAHPAKTLLKLREGEWSYGEVNEMADRLAQGFAAIGVRQHNHVAVMLPNCSDFLFVTLALAKLGAVAVPINIEFKGDILRHVLDTSDAAMLVVDEPCLGRVAELEDRLPRLASLIVRTEGVPPESFRGTRKPAVPLALLRRRGEAPRAHVRHCHLQAIMYTSGTTGRSKGVTVPHAHALTGAKDSMELLAYRPDETIYCPLPLFHAAALWDGFMTALLAECSIAVVERFSASRFWDDVRRFGANVAMGIFSMIPILLKKPPAPDDRDHPLRALYLGKSALDEAFHERFGVRSVESYTSTEVGIGTCSPYGEWRVGSCGGANEATFEVKVVDDEDNEMGPGDSGEIVVRPRRPYVMTLGYYNEPSATARAFRNLWFHTGDRAYRDEDGYFYFVERMKDCIRRRGENISAFEVEQAVNAHPAVLESAAFAVPSDVEEDELKVAVVPVPGVRLDEDELVAFCQEQLPSFMVPSYVEFVNELPKSAIGKIAKHQLREQAAREMAGQGEDLGAR